MSTTNKNMLNKRLVNNIKDAYIHKIVSNIYNSSITKRDDDYNILLNKYLQTLSLDELRNYYSDGSNIGWSTLGFLLYQCMTRDTDRDELLKELNILIKVDLEGE